MDINPVNTNPQKQNALKSNNESKVKSDNGNEKTVMKDVVTDKLKKKVGMKEQVKQTMDTFNVSSINKGTSKDLVASSGNDVLKKGITNNIKLGKDTSTNEIKGSKLVGNNDIIAVWKEANSSETRNIVMDYSKSEVNKKADGNSVNKNSIDAQI